MDQLTPAARDVLAAVLDEIIPPSADGRLPGAGTLGLAAEVEAFLAGTPGGLADVAVRLDALAGDGFARLAGARRTEALRSFEARSPGLVASLLAPTIVRYYQAPRVLVALGLEARPPHPKGHVLEAGDLGPLEAVRRRGKIYREC